jgi:hypothetical protein
MKPSKISKSKSPSNPKLAKQLRKESLLVGKNSLEVLQEFERLENSASSPIF